MVTYYDALNDVFKYFENRRHKRGKHVPASVQLMLLHLLHEWNCLKRPQVVRLSDYEVSLRTNLCKQTITEAKQWLKNVGLIDFVGKKGVVTEYTFKFFSAKTEAGYLAGEEAGNALGNPAGNSGSVCNAAQASEVSEASEASERESFSTKTAAGACAKEGLTKVLETWAQNRGNGCLLERQLIEMRAWLGEFGENRLCEIVLEAADSWEPAPDRPHALMSFKWLRACVEAARTPKPLKIVKSVRNEEVIRDDSDVSFQPAARDDFFGL